MTQIPTLPLIILIFVSSMLFSLCSSTIHDLLRSQGLPGGLFPKNVKSYAIGQDGFLEVRFDEPCETMYENLVRFDSVVTANLTYGALIGVQGLTQEELFLWLRVQDIIVDDPSSGLIMFDIGYAQKQLSFSDFLDPPICNPQWSSIKMVGMEKKDANEVEKL